MENLNPNPILKSGTRRITIDTLQVGQERNYAPIVHKYQVYFEWIPYIKDAKGFEPDTLPIELIKPFLKTIKYWKFDETIGEKRSNSMEDAFSPRLTELKMIIPGLWQFTVTEEFCD